MRYLQIFLFTCIFICFFCFTNLLHSEQDSTMLKPIKITASIGGNISLHNANFAQLPGIPNCCSGFTKGNGFSPVFSAGIEFVPENLLFSLPYTYGISLGYAGVGGDLTTEEFSFNVISGNTLSRAISRHNLATNISVVTLDPYITLFPLSCAPLGITAGVSAGAFVAKTFTQSQEIIEPNTIKWVETGSSIKGAASGTIPNSQSIFIAPFMGIRYDIGLTQQITLSPNVRISPQITPFVNDLTWTAIHIRPSIDFQYRLAEPQPEKLPPPPPPPPLEIPKKLELAIVVKKQDGSIINDGETVKVTYEIQKKVYAHDAAPIVFFKKNTSDISPQIPLASTSSEENAQASVLLGLVSLLRENVEAKVELVGYAAPDESASIADERVGNVAKFLLDNGVDNIQILTRIVKPEGTVREIRDELLDEERSVRIVINGKQQTIPVVFEQSETKHTSITLYFEPRIIAEAIPFQAFGKVNFEMKKMFDLADKDMTLQFTTNDILQGQPTRIVFDYALADATDRRTAAGLQFKISPTVTTLIENNKFYSSNMSNSDYVLGYFNFNASEFASVNMETLEYIKNAIKNGKKIQLSPKTDNFGTPEYNVNLAKSRVKSAMQLLGIDESKCTINYDNIQQNYDPSAIARILHRTVTVRVIE